MRRSRSGYSGYRGRRTIHDVLKIVAAVLGVLVVLTLAALLLGQRFIIFTDSGIRVDLPFLGGGGETPPDPGNVSVVIDEGEDIPPDPAEEQPPSHDIQGGGGGLTVADLPDWLRPDTGAAA